MIIFCVAADKEIQHAASYHANGLVSASLGDKTKNDMFAGLLLNTVEESGKMWYNTKSYIAGVKPMAASYNALQAADRPRNEEEGISKSGWRKRGHHCENGQRRRRRF